MVTIIVGKSGAGKDTIQEELVNEYNFERIVTSTTRPIREGEVDGKDYNFLSNEEFQKDIEDDKFIDCRAYDTLVEGKADTWFYGSQKQELEESKDYVIILDVEGAKNFVDYYGKENCFVAELQVKDSVREERAMSRSSFDKVEWNRRIADDTEKFSYDNKKDAVNFSIDNTFDYEATAYSIIEALDVYENADKHSNKHYIVDMEVSYSYNEPPEPTYTVMSNEEKQEYLKAIESESNWLTDLKIKI